MKIKSPKVLLTKKMSNNNKNTGIVNSTSHNTFSDLENAPLLDSYQLSGEKYVVKEDDNLIVTNMRPHPNRKRQLYYVLSILVSAFLIMMLLLKGVKTIHSRPSHDSGIDEEHS
jgi:hypothetical protein